MKKSTLISLVAVCLAVGAGCNQPTSSTTDGDADHPHTASMPHGGTPVQVGDHDYHLELVNDATEGKMTAYVLDDHAEKPATVAPTTFEMVAKLGGEEKRLSFQPMTNNATSTNVSAFVATADWLKTATNFDAVIPTITLGGESFTDIKFSYPKGSLHSH